MIEVKNLSKKFGDRVIFKDINFSIKPGTVSVVIGPSGTGKSTMLRCLNLLERPETGIMVLGDKEIDLSNATKQEIQYIREHISMVFQAFNLFKNKTALNNIVQPLVAVKKTKRAEAEMIAEELLEKVGLSHRRDAYPVTLSGGEQQRVGIARAMGMKSDMILFDEPTSALDPGLVSEVLQVIQKLEQENVTMLIVTHEMRFAQKIADQIIFMDEGSIVEIAPPDQLFNHPKDPRTVKFLEKMNS